MMKHRNKNNPQPWNACWNRCLAKLTTHKFIVFEHKMTLMAYYVAHTHTPTNTQACSRARSHAMTSQCLNNFAAIKKMVAVNSSARYG